jgi:hypothetical protein
MGSFGTCSAVGFVFTTFSVVVAIYNCSLSINFVLAVVYNWTNPQIKRRFERPAHIFAWVWPLCFMIPAVSTKSINPEDLTMVCTTDAYPPRCHVDEEVDCIRGQLADLFDSFFLITIVVVSIVGFGGTLWVYWSFQRQAKANQRYHFGREFQRSESQAQMNLTRAVANRAVLYSLIYFNTVIWPILVKIVETKTGAEAADQVSMGVYTLLLLSWCLYPLQGFFNLMVYIRPHMYAWRRVRPKDWSLSIFIHKVLKGIAPPQGASTIFQFAAPQGASTIFQLPPGEGPRNINDRSSNHNTDCNKDDATDSARGPGEAQTEDEGSSK